MDARLSSYPAPQAGASLLISVRLPKQTLVILGSNSLAASRAVSALEADTDVVVISPVGFDDVCPELRWRAEHGHLSLMDWDSLPDSVASQLKTGRLEKLDHYLSSKTDARLLCVTDTLLLDREDTAKDIRRQAEEIRRICQRHRVLINVTDMPTLCDFMFMSQHRVKMQDGEEMSPLQVGVTTNGHGCRLASRIKRDLVAHLPKDVGRAVLNVGRLRSMAKALDVAGQGECVLDSDMNEENGILTPNQPVPLRSSIESPAEQSRRRMKWVAQVSEYWPIDRLAKLSPAELSAVLCEEKGLQSNGFLEHETLRSIDRPPNALPSLHHLSISRPASLGKIFLVGSGPGHPSLLTLATHTVLTKRADLVLSDKLVPAAVLALIPPTVEVRIARKFPGNAEGAQIEMMEVAVEAAKKGLTVVRLKQGDPVVYGRAGEEVLYFRQHGFEPVVVPGVSSALGGPTFAGIPVTQRGAAESFIVCTGVGRQGKEVTLPGYDRGRTLLILMGVARLGQVVQALVEVDGSPPRRDGPCYPTHVPIAIIERASMPDQRVIFSTLRSILAALDSVGEQRPPGMIVVGWSVLSLWGSGDMTLLDRDSDKQDEKRIAKWLEGAPWRITEGCSGPWESL